MSDDDISSMTPQQAGQRLAEMTKAYNAVPEVPTTPAQAKARLDQLSRDESWRQDYLNGNPNARKEFARLTAQAASTDTGSDRLGQVLSGAGAPGRAADEPTVQGELPTHDLVSAVSDLREIGLNDAQIRQAVEGSKVSRAEFQAAQTLHNALYSNPDWVKLLMSGNTDCRREATLLSIILSGEIE
jgi:hypothetical protein